MIKIVAITSGLIMFISFVLSLAVLYKNGLDLDRLFYIILVFIVSNILFVIFKDKYIKEGAKQ